MTVAPLGDDTPRADRYGSAVAADLPVLSGLLSLLLVVVTVVLPFVATGTARLVLPVVSAVSAVGLAALCAWSSRRPVPAPRAQPWALLVVLLAGGNALLALGLEGEPNLTAYVLLVLVLAGLALPGRRWLAVAHVLVWAGWLGCLPALPGGTFRAWVAQLLLATLLGGVVGLVRRGGIDRLAEAAEGTERAAVEDGLTGLLNRRGLTLVGEQVLQNARRVGNAVHCTILDVEGLGGVNERLGHAAGDRVLVAVAQALHGCVRAGDVVARWGGDEFCVLGPGAGTAPVDLEKRVRGRLAEHPIEDVPGWQPQVNAGSAMLAPWDDGNLPELLEQADREMNRRRALRHPQAGSAGTPGSPSAGGQ